MKNLYKALLCGFVRMISSGVNIPKLCAYLAVLLLVISMPAISIAKNGGPANTPPGANAGADASIVENSSITLTGTCDDADAGDRIGGSWMIVAGSCIGPPGNPVRTDELGQATDRPRTITGSCTAPAVESETVLAFELSCDDGTDTVADTVSITVTSLPDIQRNTAPAAAAGSDDEVADASEITLTGTCNDADLTDKLEGSWRVITGSCRGNLKNEKTGENSDRPRTVTATCAAPDVDSDSFMTFELSCSDGTASAADNVTVYINAAPIAGIQTLSVTENSQIQITLSGEDPNGESLSYSVVTDPKKGSLGGTPPNLTYTPSSGARGQDDFEYVVSDRLQISRSARVIINILLNNQPPECTVDVEGAQDAVEKNPKKIKMPGINCTDADGDVISTQWVQIGNNSPGRTLHFTDDNEIDLTNYKYKRGTYFAQMIAQDDKGNATAGDIIWVKIPNNPPEFIEEEEAVEGMRVENHGGQYRYVPDTFTNFINLSAPMTDFDDDGLSVTWRVTRGLDGYRDVTEDGTGARIRIRNAGTTIVEVAADDGYGGISVEEFIIYQPPPEIEETTLNLSAFIISTGSPASLVMGYFSVPVIPIVTVEGIAAESSLTTLSTIELFKADEEVIYDTYMFRAKGVPIAGDSSSLDIDISTDVDGEKVSLFGKSLPIKDGEIEEGGEEPTGYGGDSDGCSLARGTRQAGGNSLMAILILLVFPVTVFWGERENHFSER